MPLFFFHLRTDRGLDRDDVGTPFPDLDTAYLDACRAIPEMLKGLHDGGHDPMRCAFEIADEDGRPLMDVPFAERLTRAINRPPREAASATGPEATEDLISRSAAAVAECQASRRLTAEARALFGSGGARRNASVLEIIALAYGLPEAGGDGSVDAESPARR